MSEEWGYDATRRDTTRRSFQKQQQQINREYLWQGNAHDTIIDEILLILRNYFKIVYLKVFFFCIITLTGGINLTKIYYILVIFQGFMYTNMN